MADKTANDALTDKHHLKLIDLTPLENVPDETWEEIGREIESAFKEVEEAFHEMVAEEAKGGA